MNPPISQFRSIVIDTVLVCLELLIESESQEILVGSRGNSPAKGKPFVPGGRIEKGETSREALVRISKEELGIELRGENATLHGIYHHRFADSSFAEPAVDTTEYITIACLFRLSSEESFKPDSQHDRLQFIPIHVVRTHPEIHEFTQSCFAECPSNAFLGAGANHCC
jgi:colanic acid biosynthesis protein WcaH